MIKVLTVVFSSVFLYSSILAEEVKFTGFEKEDNTHVKASKNASAEIIQAGKDEVIPEGERYLKAKLVPGSCLSVTLPAGKAGDAYTKITMWIKGTSGNKMGPNLSLGNWRWKGTSINKASLINVEEPEWVKYEFRIEDFIWYSYKGEKATGPLRIKDHNRLTFTLSGARNNSGSVEFMIDDIEVE